MLICKGMIKDMAFTSRDDPRSISIDASLSLSEPAVSQMKKMDALRQVINRVRKNKAGFGQNAPDLASIVIPENLTNTYRNQKFYWSDRYTIISLIKIDRNYYILITFEQW